MTDGNTGNAGADAGKAAVSGTVGDAATRQSENGGASATVPAGVGAKPAEAAADWRLGWDDGLKNDPSLKDFKDPQSLAKAFVETKKLVGQKTGVPGADATPEQKAAFYKSLGVPENADGYGLVVPQEIPEAMRESYSNDTLKWFSGVAKEANLTPEQAKFVQKAYDGKIVEFLNKTQTDIATSEGAFDEMATKIFGDKKVEALTAARADVEKYIPKELHADFANMSNSALLAVARVATAIRKELGGEDRNINKDGDSSTGRTAAEIRAEARELSKLPEHDSPFAKGKEVHEEMKKRVRGLYQEADKMEKASKSA